MFLEFCLGQLLCVAGRICHCCSKHTPLDVAHRSRMGVSENEGSI
jgi:hypothetical protein